MYCDHFAETTACPKLPSAVLKLPISWHQDEGD